MSDPDEDYSLLISAVRDAGALAMQYFGKNPATWEKPGGTVVTDADIAVDGFLRTRLAGARPDYGWLSEETEDDRTRLARRQPGWWTRSTARAHSSTDCLIFVNPSH